MTVFDKLHELKDALKSDSDDQQRASSGEHKDHEQLHEETKKEEKEKEGWSDKLRNVLDIDETKKKREEEKQREEEERKRREEEEERIRLEKLREEAKAHVEAERGLRGKIHDALDHGKHKQELEEAEFQRLEAEARIAKVKQEGSFHGRIESHVEEFKDKVEKLTKDPREKADEREEAEQEGLTDKVKELWNKAPKEEKDKQEEHRGVWSRKKDEEDPDEARKNSGGWRDQLRALAGSDKKEEKEKVERSWLKEKLNEMGGGGAKSEADEDKLDKVIDFVQEHVLRQGDQSNESALEQLKDEQISDAIRAGYKQVTGHELPVKDK